MSKMASKNFGLKPQDLTSQMIAKCPKKLENLA